jgi:hypothetical protein
MGILRLLELSLLFVTKRFVFCYSSGSLPQEEVWFQPLISWWPKGAGEGISARYRHHPRVGVLGG